MYNFEKLFLATKKATDDFKIINAEILRNVPKGILILRLICGLTHLKLTEIYKEKFKKTVRFNLYEQEHDKIGKKVGDRLASIFIENLPDKIEYEKIKERYKKIEIGSKSYHRIGKKLEEKVKKILEREKIKFNQGISIIGKSGIPIDVDFVIPSRIEPTFVIECKVLKGLSGHDSFRSSRIMALNSIELKVKKIKYIAIISGVWTKNSFKLLKNYCIVVPENKLNTLPQLIK
jgi:hypothetical protein